MISDGKSLLIKNENSKTSYLYPLKKTPLYLLLDKDFLINKIRNLEERILNDRYINFSIIEENNTINVFFDNKKYLLYAQCENLPQVFQFLLFHLQFFLSTLAQYQLQSQRQHLDCFLYLSLF